jgi:hypothetical protein
LLRLPQGNVKNIKFFWVPVLFAYFTTMHTLYLLKREYDKFIQYRLDYLAKGDPDVNAQKVKEGDVDCEPSVSSTDGVKPAPP